MKSFIDALTSNQKRTHKISAETYASGVIIVIRQLHVTYPYLIRILSYCQTNIGVNISEIIEPLSNAIPYVYNETLHQFSSEQIINKEITAEQNEAIKQR